MRCSNCHGESVIAAPKCPHCGAWGTLSRWQKFEDVKATQSERVEIGVSALDDLFGGGLVRSFVYRIYGPPGCGKSTMALEIASHIASSAYLCGEEKPGSVRLRGERLGCAAPTMVIGETTRAEDVLELPPEIVCVVVDSLNVLNPEIRGENERLVHAIGVLCAWAKKRDGIGLVIGHVNGDGDAAGTTKVDHLIDGQVEMVPAVVGGRAGEIIVHKNRQGAIGKIYYRHRARGLAYAKKEEEVPPEEEACADSQLRAGVEGDDRPRAGSTPVDDLRIEGPRRNAPGLVSTDRAPGGFDREPSSLGSGEVSAVDARRLPKEAPKAGARSPREVSGAAVVETFAGGELQ